MDTETKDRLVAALAPVRSRVRGDICWRRGAGDDFPRRISEPLDDDRLRQHVNGGPVYGAAPIRPGSSVTLVAVLDLDSHKGETPWPGMVEAARGIIDVADIMGLAPIPFRSSGGRGIHLYFVWDAPQDARSVRAALAEVLDAVGFKVGSAGVSRGQVEIFPKQDRVDLGRFGNMFDLPLAGQSVPLLGDELRAGEKEDATGVAWPVSDPVPVAARAAPLERREDAPADLTVLAQALEALPNDDREYDDWMRIVLSIHAATAGSQDGRELARAWSAKSGKHADEVFDRKVWDWASDSGEKERTISGEYVFWRAREAGWMDPRIIDEFDDLDEIDRQKKREQLEAGTPSAPVSPQLNVPTVQELKDRWVYLSEGARAAPRDAPHLVLPFREMKSLMAAAVDVVVGKKATREVCRADTWLKSVDRLTVHSQTFSPGQPEFCRTPHGDPAQNLWVPRELRPGYVEAPADWRERAQPFFDHIEYLVPDAETRRRFVQWLAHIEQRPGELPHTHYLFMARQTGIGRNWLAYTLGRSHKGYAALGFKLADCLKSGFNGMLSRTVLACVDELNAGGTGLESQRMGEELKSMLTEETRTINPKYGRQHVEYNCTRFLMFSNHDTALPLAENDRRVIVVENPIERREPGYYQALYRLLDDRLFIASVTRALSEVDISDFRAGDVAPMSAAKRVVVAAGRSDVGQALADVAASWPSACITAADLKNEVSEMTGIGVDRLGRLAPSAATAGLRAYPGPVKIDGKATRVWLLRGVGVWHTLAPGIVAEEVRSGRRKAAEDAGAVERAENSADDLN